MIDTLSFKLHNLSSYGHKADNFIKNEKVTVGGMKYKEFTNRRGEVDRKEFQKSTLTSASYDINYNIFLSMDYIQFEFSLPKYIYGHNLYHFPQTFGNMRDLLKDFLDSFFKVEFFVDIKFTDIEIDRIDFCYNYNFKAHQNKMHYRSNMNNLFQDAFRTSSILNYSNNQTAMYKTQDYSFKVYDKHEEFIKHDAQKIYKFRGQQELMKLSALSENMLRTELTFRKRKLSYEFFNNLENTQQLSRRLKNKMISYRKTYSKIEKILRYFRNYTNDFFMGHNKDFSKCRSYCLNSTDFSTYFNQEKFDSMIQILESIKADNKYRREYKESDFKNLVKRGYLEIMIEYNKMRSPKKVMLELTPSFRKIQKTFTHGIDVIEFDDNFMNHLRDKFISLIQKVNSQTSSETTPMNVLYHNREILKDCKESISPIRKYYAIRQKYTDKQIIQLKLMSRQWLYKMKKKIENVNCFLLEKNCSNTLTLLNIPEKIIFDKTKLLVNTE